MTTSLKLPKTAKLGSEDAARTLGKLLLRAKTFESPAIAMVEFPSELSRRNAIDALEVYLSNTDDKLTDVDLRQPIDLLETISKLRTSEVASVHGLHAQPEVVGQLNWGRERLTDANKRAILWLNPEEAKDLIRRAPDFWRFRNRHLVLAPLAEDKGDSDYSQPYHHTALSLSNLSAQAKCDRIAALEELLESIEDVESPKAQGIRRSVAQLHRGIGQYKQAIRHLETALEISHKTGDRGGESADLGNAGNVYCDIGKANKGIQYLRQALELSREIGDKQGESNSLGSLGFIYRHLGDIEKSTEHLQKALDISYEIDDIRSQVNWLGNLGNTYRGLGELQKSIAYFHKALEISRKIGDKQGESANLGSLGNVLRELGEVKKAIEHYRESLKISRHLGDKRNESVALGNLGLAYRDLGETSKAVKYHQQALNISREIGDRRGEGNHLANLGKAYRNLGELDKAVAVWLLSFFVFQAIRSPSQDAVLNSLYMLITQKSNFGTLLRNLFPSGDIILNKATDQTYTFYKDAPPDMSDQILKMLNEYEKDNPESWRK